MMRPDLCTSKCRKSTSNIRESIQDHSLEETVPKAETLKNVETLKKCCSWEKNEKWLKANRFLIGLKNIKRSIIMDERTSLKSFPWFINCLLYLN